MSVYKKKQVSTMLLLVGSTQTLFFFFFFTVQFNILLFSLCGALERSHINNDVSKNMQKS